MRQLYILDTSALINDPNLFKSFPDSDIVIPIAVLHELDNLKKQANEAGKNARISIKLLDELTQNADVTKFIPLDNNIRLKIDTSYSDSNLSIGPVQYGDTQILICAQKYVSENPTLVSNDINLRVKAKAFGLKAIGHEKFNTSISDIYSGIKEVQSESLGMELNNKNVIDYNDLSFKSYLDYDLELNPNECVVFKRNNDVISLGRRAGNKIKLIRKSFPWGLTPRNTEQILALDLLQDENIDLLTLIGKAGTGKSLCVLAAALDLVLNKKKYDKLVIYRPIQPVGNDIGFLPGDMSEKLGPWFQAVMDNLEFLLSKNSEWKKDLELYQKKGRIEMEAITYVRGRSLPNTIIFLDEAQNLSKEEIKTLLTRAGENSKVVITGDIEQIDNKDLDATNNGLTHIVEAFKESDITGHVTLTRGERSKLATLAAKIL